VFWYKLHSVTLAAKSSGPRFSRDIKNLSSFLIIFLVSHNFCIGCPFATCFYLQRQKKKRPTWTQHAFVQGETLLISVQFEKKAIDSEKLAGARKRQDPCWQHEQEGCSTTGRTILAKKIIKKNTMVMV
jgi:hypothetical protein